MTSSSRARAVLWTSVAAGLLAGAALGWAQALVLAWPHREFLNATLWADVLSYAGLAHALLWAGNGLVLGGVAALAALLVPPLARRIAPGALALALFAASASAFLLWSGAAFLGISLAGGIQPTWCVLILLWWTLAFVATYSVSALLAPRWPGRVLAALTRLALIPTALTLVLCAGLQWRERPSLASGPLWQGGEGSSGSRPNVVLLVIDTQRADRFGSYGYPRPTTPRIDAFAADAHVFENCTSAAIWTLPSHASMFTGLFPSEHWTHYDHRWLDDEFVTLAELLAEKGYETAAFSNNTWVSSLSNVTQGFDFVFRPGVIHHARGNSISEFVDKVLYPAGRVGPWLGALTAEDVGAKYTATLVRRWLDARSGDRPFFLFVNLTEPHAPYRPHLPHRKLFVEQADLAASYRSTFEGIGRLEPDASESAELEILNRVYDGETRLIDDYVGQLLDELSQRVSVDDTIFVLTADHGENLGDHGMQGHVNCVYETLVHVPLIVRYPPRLPAGRSAEPVQTVDILPTVLDAVHGGPVDTLSTFGRSLLLPPGASAAPTGSPSQPAGRIAVAEFVAPPGPSGNREVGFDATPLRSRIRSVRQGPWKYIAYSDGREELYHIEDDPGETRDRIADRRDVADELAMRLSEWLAERRPYEPPASPSRGGEVRMDEATRARLRALGYIP